MKLQPQPWASRRPDWDIFPTGWMAAENAEIEPGDTVAVWGCGPVGQFAMTQGRGPDRCIDAVGTEAHGTGSIDAVVDRAKQAVRLGTDRPHVLREAIMNCRKGGTVSIPGVYIGFLDKIPMGAAMNKGLTLRMGQTHVPRYHKKLLARIEAGEIDPAFVITHTLSLEGAPEAYRNFCDKEDQCIKVVLKPGMRPKRN